MVVFSIVLSGCANEKINQSQKQEGNTTKNSSEESNLRTEMKSSLSGYKVTFASRG